MDFTSVRVITADIRRLVGFYESVTGVSATWYTPEFAEITTPLATLAIGSTATFALFAGDAPAGPRGSDSGSGSGSVIIEFRVDDVDKAYRELAGQLTDVLQEPATMPWGNRSLLFRDPDGNLVNFFTPVTRAATEKLAR